MEPDEALSARELDTFSMRGTGYTAAEIADELCVAVKTASTHPTRMRQKLKAKNSSQLDQRAATWFAKNKSSSQSRLPNPR